MGNGTIKFLIDSVLSVIYSRNENCLLCNIYCNEEDLVCGSCLKKIEFYNDSFTLKKDGVNLECFSAAYYSGAIPELVKRLKYKSDFNCGDFLAQYLTNLTKIKSIDYDLICYVPMTRKSLRNRGFNQSRFLALSVGKAFDKPVEKLVAKIKETKDQIGLDEENRWENLKKCFKATNKNKIQNKKILLVDDVLTTGATAFCCAKELLDFGAEKVSILTVAKSKL